VRLELDEVDPNRPLFSGISVTARVDTGYRRTWLHLFSPRVATAGQMSVALPLTGVTSDHRAITVAALMATYMEAVEHLAAECGPAAIQGTLSMANDEVGWVFTAYMAAGAAVMPMGALAGGALRP